MFVPPKKVPTTPVRVSAWLDEYPATAPDASNFSVRSALFGHGSQAPRTAWGQVSGGAIPPALPGACEPCRYSGKSAPSGRDADLTGRQY
jgi:hypothetical protein